MAWTATIKQKGIQDSALLVNVLYSNGTVQFNEVLDMTGQTQQTFSDRVSGKLAVLEATQTLLGQLTTGPFVPLAAPASSAQSVFASALAHFRACQRAADLGLITVSDQVYLDAKAAMIANFTLPFIDSV